MQPAARLSFLAGRRSGPATGYINISYQKSDGLSIGFGIFNRAPRTGNGKNAVPAASGSFAAEGWNVCRNRPQGKHRSKKKKDLFFQK